MGKKKKNEWMEPRTPLTDALLGAKARPQRHIHVAIGGFTFLSAFCVYHWLDFVQWPRPYAPPSRSAPQFLLRQWIAHMPLNIYPHPQAHIAPPKLRDLSLAEAAHTTARWLADDTSPGFLVFQEGLELEGENCSGSLRGAELTFTPLH